MACPYFQDVYSPSRFSVGQSQCCVAYGKRDPEPPEVLGRAANCFLLAESMLGDYDLLPFDVWEHDSFQLAGSHADPASVSGLVQAAGPLANGADNSFGWRNCTLSEAPRSRNFSQLMVTLGRIANHYCLLC